MSLYPHLQSRRIVLASQSPRRRQLMEMMGLNVECMARDLDESWPAGMEGTEVASYVALRKAEGYLDVLSGDDILITGDTVVVLDGEVLEKPTDAADAKRMLRQLSGQTHTVASAVAVTTRNGGSKVALDLCHVTFRVLDDLFLDTYIATGSPMDKAGAYGVQDLMGLIGVDAIQGSFYTVMGMPTHRLHDLLLDL